jgi:hypothetical protein
MRPIAVNDAAKLRIDPIYPDNAGFELLLDFLQRLEDSIPYHHNHNS